MGATSGGLFLFTWAAVIGSAWTKPAGSPARCCPASPSPSHATISSLISDWHGRTPRPILEFMIWQLRNAGNQPLASNFSHLHLHLNPPMPRNRERGALLRD